MRSTSRSRLLFLIPILWAATANAQQPASETKPTESTVITGRVVNESGHPLPGATVYAGTVGGAPGQRTATDNEGNFKLHGLDVGLYRVMAILPGYIPPNFQSDPNNPAPTYRPGASASLTLIKGGVISGIVTNGEGEPVINVSVRAFRIRDAEGNRLRAPSNPQSRMTDDRGYYRLYGLPPGSYVVAAGGQGQYFGSANPFANDAMTFAPSSTRDTAVEIIVRSDQEVPVEIRYRGEPGHSVSGRVSGSLPTAPYGSSVRLSDIETRTTLLSIPISTEDRTFQLNGVSDGEYEIAATAGGGVNTDYLASPGRRISVKGADVTGLELVLAPMASIAGRVRVEPDQHLNCARRRETALRETVIVARREPFEEKTGSQKVKDKPDEAPEAPIYPLTLESVPNEGGEIIFRNLIAANYRLEVRPPGVGWYVREVVPGNLGQSGPGRTSGVNIPKNGIPLKTSERFTNLAIAIAEGGAAFRGRITTGEGQNLPAGLRLYLVPADRESSENVLRFFEGTVSAEGAFGIGNIAPGRYWIVAHLPEPIDSNSNTVKSIKRDSVFRAKVMREAETVKKEIVFKPCERTVDFEFPYAPAPPAKPLTPSIP